MFALLALALATEFLDGALARRYGWATLTGQILDPIADRLLFLSVGVSLISSELLSIPLFFTLATRDIVVAMGFFGILIVRKDRKLLDKFRPNFLGKATTAFQYFAFFQILLTSNANLWIIGTTGILGLISALVYALSFPYSTQFDQDGKLNV
jgi:cardiolipin synthase